MWGRVLSCPKLLTGQNLEEKKKKKTNVQLQEEFILWLDLKKSSRILWKGLILWIKTL